MKVVLDTNIFISGIHWSGSSEKILYAWFDNRFEFVCSESIIEEITETLMNFRIPLSMNDLLKWIIIISERAVIVKPSEKLDIVKEDSDDNKFLEAAIAGNAQYIISQDKHLLRIKEFRKVKIITPEKFLKILESTKI